MANEACVLIILQQVSQLSSLLGSFLEKSKLKPVVVLLDEDNFLDKLRKVALEHGEAYKTILLYSQRELKKQDHLKQDLLFNEIESRRVDFGNLVLISSLNSYFEFADVSYPAFEEHVQEQTSFIGGFLARFGDGAVFLGQDLLDELILNNYPPLLFLSSLEQQKVPTFVNKIGIQDAGSFFALFQEYLLKPHQPHRFLIIGKKESVAALSAKFSFFYEQYFQKKLEALPLIASELSPTFLSSFSQVINTRANLDPTLDTLARTSHELTAGRASSPLIKTPVKPFGKINQNGVMVRVNKTSLQLPSSSKTTVRSSSAHLLRFLSKTDKASAQPAASPIDGFEIMESEISKVFSNRRTGEKIDRQLKNVDEVHKIVVKSKKRKLLFVIGILGLFISATLLILFAVFKLSFYIVNNQVLELLPATSQRYFSESKNDILIDKSAKIEKSVVRYLFNQQLHFYSQFITGEELKDEHESSSLLDALLISINQDLLFSSQIYSFYQQFMTGGANLSSSKDDLFSTLEKKIQLEKELNNVLSGQNLSLMDASNAAIWQTRLEDNRSSFKSSLNSKLFLTTLLDLLSKQQRFNVLIVEQDNDVVRGSGGVVKFFHVLSFSDRGLINKQKISAEELQQINYGQKIPKQLANDIFSGAASEISSLNYSADFVNNAQEYALLTSQALGLRTDLLFSFHTGVDNQKFADLLNKIDRLSSEDFLQLLSLVGEGLDKKEFFAYSPNASLQQFFESNLWSGQQISHQCPADFYQANCLVDYFMQLQNDLGADNHPAYIQTVEHNIGVGEQLIRHKRQISFQAATRASGQSRTEDFRALEFFMNRGAVLERIDFNGRQLDPSEWLLVDDQDYLHVLLKLGFSRSKNNELTLIYSLKNELAKPFAYTFLEQKQAGIANKKSTYGVVFSDELRPQLIAPQALYKEKTIQFERENSDHFFFAVNFD